MSKSSDLNRPLESNIQQAYFDWVDLMIPVDFRFEYIYANCNQGGNDESAKTRGKILLGQGMRPGVPDITIAYPIGQYHGAYFELKRVGNEPSPKQKEWLNRLHKAGYYVKCLISDNAEFTIKETKLYFRIK